MATTLSNVHLWSGSAADRRSTEPWHVRIEGDRIAAMGPDASLAANSEVIPLDGATALPGLIDDLRELGVRTDIVFLHASDEILLQRYSESRRRHPLAKHGTELRKAISAEREVLTHMNNAADLVIDTSRTSIYELADVIRERVDRRKSEALSVLIESFGFKYQIPADADFVFDMRCLPNPYWHADLRGLSGLDKEVINFLGPWKTADRVEWETLKWVNWYNTERLHSAIDYVTPQ